MTGLFSNFEHTMLEGRARKGSQCRGPALHLSRVDIPLRQATAPAEPTPALFLATVFALGTPELSLSGIRCDGQWVVFYLCKF